MKKADKPNIVININVYGDNNKVSMNETRSHFSAVIIVIILIMVAVLYPFAALNYFLILSVG